MEDNREHKPCEALHEAKKFNNLKEMLQNTRKEFGNETAFKFKTDEPGVLKKKNF